VAGRKGKEGLMKWRTFFRGIAMLASYLVIATVILVLASIEALKAAIRKSRR
jgi:hypothetical protein